MSADTARKSKTMVIGLDSATFALMDPWLDQGKLPNIRKLMEQGSSGILRSTVPPLSPVAWTSFKTGMNPGKHGVFDFFEPVRDRDYQIRMTSGRDYREKPLWGYLNQTGHKTIVMNVPMTFPPEQLDGIMISGFDTPSIKAEFTSPRAFKQELLAKVPGYIIEVEHADRLLSHPDRYIATLHRMIERRLKAVLYLMENKPWDFFMVVFMAADRAHHNLWKFMDPAHPEHGAPGAGAYKDAILHVYQALDKAVGEITGRLDDTATVAIVSDHGADIIFKTIDLNTWLIDNNFLSLKREAFSVSRRVLDKVGYHVGRIAKKLPFAAGQRPHKFFEYIDWPNTRAYFLGAYGKLFVNLKGREPHGIVAPGEEYEKLRQEIAERLSRLVDPDTGKPVVKRIIKREDVYRGEFLDRAPDLIIEWVKGYNSIVRLDKLHTGLRTSGKKRIFAPHKLSGDHTFDGIFIIRSPHIARNRRHLRADIIDICPTIMHIMGLPIPEHMDGIVLQELLDKDFLRKRPVSYSRVSAAGAEGPNAPEYTPDQEKEVQERLKALGYLD